jgi:hypothetical protein
LEAVGLRRSRCGLHPMILRCSFQAGCRAWLLPVMSSQRQYFPREVRYGQKAIDFSVQLRLWIWKSLANLSPPQRQSQWTTKVSIAGGRQSSQRNLT